MVDDQWHLVGFVSESDILRCAMPSYLQVLAQDSFLYGEHELLEKKFAEIRTAKVGDFMRPDCYSVQPSTSIMNVADMMLRFKVKRLPVLDGRLLVGIIDRADLCEYLLDSGNRS